MLNVLIIALLATTDGLSVGVDRRTVMERWTAGGVLLFNQGVGAKECDDNRPEECFFLEDRQFRFAGRTLTVHQKFGQVGTTGSAVWNGAEALASYLSENDVVRGKRVQEIGCGCALVSMVAALQDATVLATDGDPDVVDLARSNLDANGFKNVSTAVLRWENATAAKSDDDRFDVVLGADVTYYPFGGSPLPLTNALLASGASTAYLAFKRRTNRDDATVAKIQASFGPMTILSQQRDDGIRIVKFDRRSDAPPDLIPLPPNAVAIDY